MPLLRPVRAQLAATRARVAHVATPAPAWQTLADDGSIPTAWLDDTGRSFILETPTRDPPMASWSEPPATLARCALRLARRSRARRRHSRRRGRGPVSRRRALPVGRTAMHARTRVVWWSIPRESYGYVSTDTRPYVIYALLHAFGGSARSTAPQHAAICHWASSVTRQAGSPRGSPRGTQSSRVVQTRSARSRKSSPRDTPRSSTWPATVRCSSSRPRTIPQAMFGSESQYRHARTTACRGPRCRR